MGKKRRGHPDVEDMLARPWCYYCERDFEDLKLLISHQKAKHFKCDRCGRRLNTAGGLSVHLNQVHKETLNQVENALPNRQGLEVEIFGMEGIPQDILDQHRNRIIQNYYQAQEDRRIATGNPPPGQAKHPRKKVKTEAADDLLKRLADFRARKPAGDATEGVQATQPHQFDQQFQQPPFNGQGFPGQQPPYFSDGLPARPGSNGPAATALPQRPTQPGYGQEAQPDLIDQRIRAIEAGGPAQDDAAKKPKKEKGKMVYDDVDMSPEEHMAALPRYAFVAA